MKTHTTVLAAILAISTQAQQQMFSDEFDANELDARWSFSNNNADSHISINSGRLTLDASPNNDGSDYFDQSNHRAPRILQPVCGNWRVMAKMTVEPFTGDYQDAGFLLFKEDTTVQYNEQRIMMRRWLLNTCPDDQDFRIFGDNLCDFDANTMWMSLEHRGDSIIGQVSADSIVWERRAHYDTSDFRYIGLIAVRQAWNNDFNTRTQAHFDYFRVLDQDTLHIHPSTLGPLCAEQSFDLSVDEVPNGLYSWHGPDGGSLGNASTIQFPAANAGLDGWYHAVVGRLDCSFVVDSFQVTVDACLGVDEAAAPKLELYPNPAVETMTLRSTVGFTGGEWLTVTDAFGRTVLRTRSTPQQVVLDLRTMLPGAYFVRLTGKGWEAHDMFIKE